MSNTPFDYRTIPAIADRLIPVEKTWPNLGKHLSMRWESGQQLILGVTITDPALAQIALYSLYEPEGIGLPGMTLDQVQRDDPYGSLSSQLEQFADKMRAQGNLPPTYQPHEGDPMTTKRQPCPNCHRDIAWARQTKGDDGVTRYHIECLNCGHSGRASDTLLSATKLWNEQTAVNQETS